MEQLHELLRLVQINFCSSKDCICLYVNKAGMHALMGVGTLILEQDMWLGLYVQSTILINIGLLRVF